MSLRFLILSILTLLATTFASALPAPSDTLTTDVPKAGEGIGTFLLRKGLDPSVYKADFIKMNKDKLGKDNTLKLGVKYNIPQKPKDDVKVEPLLGNDNKFVKIENHSLKGAVYYLVSGHGGPDPGAMSKLNGHDLCEDEYAYDIMLRLARQLLAWDATVHIIIEDKDDGIRDDAYLAYDNHETCGGKEIPLDQIQRLKQRCEVINEYYKNERSKYCRAIFMHLDSRSEKERIDIFLYHYMKSTRGESLAKTMRNKFDEKYKQHQPNRGFSGTVSERNLYVLKMSNPAAVFLELGNIQNPKDQQRFILSSNREAVARWMAEGILEEYKNSKTR
ncbi:MAG: N-acetylmuramoyl-L-alanine amidase [Bacteroidales bacterium]|nr:N-acetylmuramoyl-L-alanine amidase [Bacteroidales bacterium]